MTAILSNARPMRTRAAIGWSELFARYLLLEGKLRGKRVLELGTIDARSLIRLHDGGASRVVGAMPKVEDIDADLLGGRDIELVELESGRVAFEEGSFDVVVVVDVARELSRAPEFPSEVRRTLRPSGIALFGFQASGCSLVELLGAGRNPAIDPSMIRDEIRRNFDPVRFYKQTPFVGVALEPDGHGDDGSVSLDPSLAGGQGRPSHILAFCGAGAPSAEDRTLVELPFVEFEALTEAMHARASSDLGRLRDELDLARDEIERKEESIREIRAKLPEIKHAIARRMDEVRIARDEDERTMTARPLPLPVDSTPPEAVTFIAPRPRGAIAQAANFVGDLISGAPRGDTLLEPAEVARARELFTAELERRDETIREHGAAVDRERERCNALEREVADLRRRLVRADEMHRLRSDETDRERSALLDELARSSERDRDRASERERLEARLAQADARLNDMSRRLLSARQSAEEDLGSDAEDFRRRVAILERTVSERDQEIHRLTVEIESQLEVRHALGGGFRDAESRIQYLASTNERVRAEREMERRASEERIAFLSRALGESDRVREELEARVRRLDADAEELRSATEGVEARQRTSAKAIERERDIANALRGELDRARAEAMESARTLDALRRLLEEREAEVARLRTSTASLGTDRRGLELAAAHLSTELDGLRERVRELRQERDALATTSAMLLAERDAASALAGRVMDAESKAQVLGRSLEGEQAAIENLERAIEETKEREHLLVLEKGKLRESLERATAELERARAGKRDALAAAEEAKTRALSFDRTLAELGHRIEESGIRERALEADRERLESLVREINDSAMESVRERDAALLERARMIAERDSILGRSVALEKELEEVRGRALDERSRLEDLERERASAKQRADDADETRARAEAARAHAIAEMRTLAERNAKLEFERSAIQRDFEALDRDRREIERRLVEVQRMATSADRAVVERLEAKAELHRSQAIELEKRFDAFRRASAERDREQSAERDALTVRANELELRNARLEAEDARYRHDALVLRVELDESRREVDALRVEVDVLCRAQRYSNARANEAEDGLLFERAGASNGRESEDLRGILVARTNEVRDLRDERILLHCRLEELENEVDALRGMLDAENAVG